MPNTTKKLLKKHQDISFIKEFATKLYNDNEKYKAEYSKTIIFFLFERPSEVGNPGIISFQFHCIHLVLTSTTVWRKLNLFENQSGYLSCRIS